MTELTNIDLCTLAILGRATYDAPLTIQALRDALVEMTGAAAPSERGIKAIMESLRSRGHLIGARRGKIHGYWIAERKDLERITRPYELQIWTMLRTMRAMAGSARVKELLGQMALAVERD